MLLIFLAAAAAAAPPATPQTPASAVHAAAPDEATVVEAIRLLDADDFDATAMHSTDLMMGVSLAGMVAQLQKQFGEALPADFVEQLRSKIHDHAMTTMRSHLPEMKRQVAEIYAGEFTREELIRLRQLHSDPVAIKARERNKAMEPKLMMIGVKTMQAAQPELEAEIKRLVSDYIAAHPNGASPSS